MGPPLRKRAQQILQLAPIESSVRPNGTPVITLLRSRSTVKKTLDKKHGFSNPRTLGCAELLVFRSSNAPNVYQQCLHSFSVRVLCWDNVLFWNASGSMFLGGRRSIRRIYRITGYPDNRIYSVLIRKSLLSDISAGVLLQQVAPAMAP